MLFPGDLADKLLARCLKKDEKRKEDATKETKAKKEKKKPAFRSAVRTQQFNGAVPQNPPGYPTDPQQYPVQSQVGYYPPAQTGYAPRPEYRACLNCKQQGHIARVCPYRAPPSAALGVAPK